MSNSITNRFLECYSILISQKKIDNAINFTKILGISPTAITEMRKDRSNVGVNAIKNICIKFNVNSDWLLTGNGPMFSETLPNIKQDYNKVFSEILNDEQFNLKKKIKHYLKENKMTIRQLANEIKMSEGNLYFRFHKNSMELEHLTKIAKVFNIDVSELVSSNVVKEGNVIYSVSNSSNDDEAVNEKDVESFKKIQEFEYEIKSLHEKILLMKENIEQLKKIILLLEKSQ